MKRRDMLRMTGSAAVLAALPIPAFAFTGRSAGTRLFFDPSDLPRIRAAAASPILNATYDKWAVVGPEATRTAIERMSETGEKIRDFAAAFEAMTREAVLHMIDPDARREAVLLDGIDAVMALQQWDYFLEGDRPIGIQRASMATERLLFFREVLGDGIGAARDARLLEDIALKGCAPCALTLAGMEDPSSVVGWRMDEQHSAYMDIDMSNWPVILGGNNLRAAPMSALGLGALALSGHNDMADEWLAMAIRNAEHCLGFFLSDGTYDEGVSYADYTLRSLLAFFDAHQRVDPTVRWADHTNFPGVMEFVLAMQAGRDAEGLPDVVNFSDAHGSTSFCCPGWIARQYEGTETAGIAQFAVERTSRQGAFHDFLWVDPNRELQFPPESYKNVRLAMDWIFCRTGWAADDAVLAFRSGPPSNHEHADRNSVFLKAYGERLLNDNHGAAYDWRQPKWLLRQTEAHNAVLIDGKGHQYHNGEEGTNASQAEAHVTRYEDAGDNIWFSSDATQAYKLVNPDVDLVRRTVAYMKPDVVVIFDEVRTLRNPSRVDVRFFADNHDNAAEIAVGAAVADQAVPPATFSIKRPNAALSGTAQSRRGLLARSEKLALDEEWGVYPYVQLTETASLRHEIVTVVSVRPTGVGVENPAAISASQNGTWSVEVGARTLGIRMNDDEPEIQWVS